MRLINLLLITVVALWGLQPHLCSPAGATLLDPDSLHGKPGVPGRRVGGGTR